MCLRLMRGLVVAVLAICAAGTLQAEEPAAIERLLAEVNTPVAVRRLDLGVIGDSRGGPSVSLRTTAIEARSLQAAYRATGFALYWSIGERNCTAYLDAGEVTRLLDVVPGLQAEAGSWKDSAGSVEDREVVFAPRSGVRLEFSRVRGQGLARVFRCSGADPLRYRLDPAEFERLIESLRAGLVKFKEWSAQ